MQFQPGQIVTFRKRLWRIDEVSGDEFFATAIDGIEGTQKRFISELENVRPAQLEKPDYNSSGSPIIQDLLLRAYRLSMLHGSAPFLSLQRSSVIPVNYQLVPLVMALEQPVTRLLIADDVGLGKTIEAGLIMAELMARGRAKRILIITPANLREQWQDALSYFFHIDTRILSSKTRREYEKELPAGANPWQFFRQIIVSIDYAKQPEQKFKILEQDWDLVVVDEAHLAAKPHQQSDKHSVTMERWKMVQDISAKTKHLLLLTATPHNGYTDSFASLIKMLDEKLVTEDGPSLRVNKNLAHRFVCQRSRKDIESWFEKQGFYNPFPKRDTREEIIPVNRDYLSVLEKLNDYSREFLSLARSKKKIYTLSEWVVLHLQKRALSSPAALRQSLQNRINEVRRRLEHRDIELTRDEKEIVKNTVFDEDPGEKLDAEEASRRTDKSMILEELDLRRQEDLLLNALELAKKITPQKDVKLQWLVKRILPSLLKNDPKVIIFTRYKDTLDYLVNQLGKVFKDIAVLNLYGDMSEAARREEFLKFEKASKAILVATDVISEGLNLQHACSQIVHYELPWNPNRLEQRNGRVDRFGQPKEKVFIRTMVMDQTLDAAVLEHLIKKANRIREDRGFCPPFFGDEVNMALLIRSYKPKSYQTNLFEDLTDPIEAAMQRRLFDPFNNETLDRIEQDSFYGAIDISLPDITERLEKTQKQIGSPEQIKKFVLSALSHYQCPVTEEKDGTLTIHIYERRLQLPGIGNRLTKATFEPRKALADPELIVLDLGHPLIKRLIDLVREDFFTVGKFYGRVAAFIKPEIDEVSVVYHYLVRFVIKTNPISVIEELLPVGFTVYNSKTFNQLEIEKMQALKNEARLPAQAEIRMHLTEAENNPLFVEAFNAAVADLKERLTAERRELKQKIINEGAVVDQEWLNGIDDLEMASHDLLTVTLYLTR